MIYHPRPLPPSRIGAAALCLALLLSVSVEHIVMARGAGCNPVRQYPLPAERLLAPLSISVRFSLAPVPREDAPTPLPALSPSPTPGPQSSSTRVVAAADSATEDPSELRHWRVQRSPSQPSLPQPAPAPGAATPPAVAPDANLKIPKGKALVINQDAQLLQVFEDGNELRALPMSSGRYPLYTPAHQGYVGHYAPTLYGYGSLADHAWYLFKAGGNIYIHGAPYKLEDGVKVYEELEFIGVKPVSHGCIRLFPADAEWLRDWNPVGVYFIVTPPNLTNRDG
ncbi:MAG: L,D-transpeptidase catalytic domain [Chloroflexi bacterium ADurb.Bin360]|nr:MAG: L,D-transpeptidase catalytic domain [Chloroflexi bacterium ADurb.Bin360]